MATTEYSSNGLLEESLKKSVIKDSPQKNGAYIEQVEEKFYWACLVDVVDACSISNVCREFEVH